VTQTLSFLGGVFYSIDSLPSPWQELSHANPIFFLIHAVCVAWSVWLFATGRRLKA